MRRVILDAEALSGLSREVLHRGGILRVEATGGSMLPFIRPGDVLHVAPACASELTVGDVVLYGGPDGHPMAHRLIQSPRRATGWRLVTCADARPGQWELVRPDRLLGRVVAYERAGRLRSLVRGRQRWLGGLWARSYPVNLGPSLVYRVARKLIPYGT